MEKDMEDFERSVASMEADLDERMAPFRPSVPDWALPQGQLGDHHGRQELLPGRAEGCRGWGHRDGVRLSG